MPDIDVNLYPEPEDILRRELAHLKARHKDELEDVKRFTALRSERDKALDELIAAAEDDAGKTQSLIVDFRAAIRKLGGKK